jgi:hypothetical protein
MLIVAPRRDGSELRAAIIVTVNSGFIDQFDSRQPCEAVTPEWQPGIIREK